jgi:peptide/nickel transport system permease protein
VSATSVTDGTAVDTDGVGPRRRPVLQAVTSTPTGVIAVGALTIIVLIAIVAPILFGTQANTQNIAEANLGPSWSHLLGTDQLGRDVFLRILVATRLSVGLAVVATLLAALVGTAIGALAALLNPRVRPVLLRAIDAMLAFPGLLTIILVSTVVGIGKTGLVVGVIVAYSAAFARLSSSLSLSASGREFVQAARLVGVPGGRLLRRHILPNVAEPLIVTASVAVSSTIVAISALSFLGLGLQSPEYDWGQMLTEGLQNIYELPVQALGPAVAICLAGLTFGFVGDVLARATNPVLWADDRGGARRRRQRGRPRLDELAPSMLSAGPVTRGETDDGPSTSNEVRSDTVLEVRDLRVRFPSAAGGIEIVKGVSLWVRSGEILGIVGESGSGKTMTAMAIAQLTSYPGTVTGVVALGGTDIAEWSVRERDAYFAANVSVVFQDPMSSFNPALRIGSQLTESIRVHDGVSRRAASERAVDRLTEVRIPGARRQLRRYPYEFSGGMRQRAMIAMGLMSEPNLIIADEPTTALDVTVQAQILELFHQVNERHGAALLLISHNLALVSQDCDRVAVMYAGRIVEELSAEDLQTNALHPYTRALVGTVPHFGQGRDESLHGIPGEVPDITAPPPGCPYHPRCTLATELCRQERPLLESTADRDRHRVACHVVNPVPRHPRTRQTA